MWYLLLSLVFVLLTFDDRLLHRLRNFCWFVVEGWKLCLDLVIKRGLLMLSPDVNFKLSNHRFEFKQSWFECRYIHFEYTI